MLPSNKPPLGLIRGGAYLQKLFSGGGYFEGGSLFKRGGLIEDLRYLHVPDGLANSLYI